MKLININKNGTLKFRLKPVVKKVKYFDDTVRESVVNKKKCDSRYI